MDWRVCHAGDAPKAGAAPPFVLERSDHEPPILRFVYADGTRFWLTADTSRIWATWPPALTPEDASTYLLGPVLGFALRLRGLEVLHASAVRVDGAGGAPTGAVALVGPAGAGKSTLAAAFARRGHAVLTEDVCAIREESPSTGPPHARFQVLPGYPLIRLWSDSVEMLYGDSAALPLLTPTWDKRYLPLGKDDTAFCTEALPLRALFILGPRQDGDAPRLESVTTAEAFLYLVGNTYRNLLLDRAQRTQEFRFLHRLLEAVPVQRVFAHEDPARIGELLDLILDASAEAPRV